MELVVDDLHQGTDEQTWLGAGRLNSLSPLRLGQPRRLVVVAPHPDDEILGAGGLLRRLRDADVETLLVAVTDGEASHPTVPTLGATRAGESSVALQRLGCGSVRVQRLGLDDGSVTEQIVYLTDMLYRALGPGDLCVAPWRADGHPDHDATGRAAAAATRLAGAQLLEYLVWAWHWATPEDAAIPWSRCRRLNLGRRDLACKRWATHAFTSQIRPLGTDNGGRPLLTDAVMRRFWRPFEVFIEPEQ